MENALKIKIFRKSILFCKYLRNGSSDLYKILCGGQLLSCELTCQILWRSVHICAHKSLKRARARFIASARVYDSCALICAQIFLKCLLVVYYYLLSLSFKFHKDPSYHWGDITLFVTLYNFEVKIAFFFSVKYSQK